MLATRDQLIQMHPKLRPLCLAHDAELIKKGIKARITCVARLAKEQVALYAQGRNDWETVNRYRELANLPKLVFDKDDYSLAVSLSPGKNKYIVTWTLNSPHLIDLDDEFTDNNWSRAYDIVILKKNGKATYDLKVDVDNNGISDYIDAAACGIRVGLVAGANFKDRLGRPRPDFPHYEVRL